VAAIAQREQAGARAAEIHYEQKECGKRVDAKMDTEPGYPERQGQRCG
jgi:hypothetical protein